MTEEIRKVLRLSGKDVEQFLQGLVTNDVTRLDDGLVYTALLTAQGKYRADFFLLRDGADILLDCQADMAAGISQILSMYKLRSDVTISETDINVTRGLGPAPDKALIDPRHASLGWRGYHGQAGQDVDWQALRVAACVPQTGVELTPDIFILEAGFERLNGVDFKKGCYVGQEVTARMKHKTELRKGLALVSVTGHTPIGTEIKQGDKTAGTLFTQANGLGIAYLRFDRAAGDLTAGTATVTYPANDASS